MSAQVAVASKRITELLHRHSKTSSDFTKMIFSRFARRTKMSHPAKQHMALIPYCLLVTPFDMEAWPKLSFDVRQLPCLQLVHLCGLEWAQTGP